MLVFFRNSHRTEFQVGYLSLSFLHNSRFLKAPSLCLPSSCHTLMNILMMLSVILVSMLKILLSILSVIRHLWLSVIRQLELVSELKPDLLHTIGWGKKQLVDFGYGRYSIDSFDWSNNTGAICVKMDGSVLKEKSSFKILGVLSLTLCLLLKLPSKKVDFFFYHYYYYYYYYYFSEVSFFWRCFLSL